MSRFYSDAYKWSLYEKFRNGFTLTELCEMTGATDKPLREWFRQIDSQYARSVQLSVKSVQQENTHLKLVVRQKQNELKLLIEIIADIPEEGGIRKTVTRRISKWQTVRQIWEKQVLQLGIAGHLLYCCLMLPRTGHFNSGENIY